MRHIRAALSMQKSAREGKSSDTAGRDRDGKTGRCNELFIEVKTNSIARSARETPAQHSLIFCVNRGEIRLDTASNNLRRSALMARFRVARRFSTGIT